MARERIFNLPPAIVWLGAAMILVQAGRMLLAAEAEAWLILAFAFLPARYHGAATLLPGGEAASLWTPLTYALLHGDWLHLLVNLLWMASFGSAVARRFGPWRFAALAVIATLAGAAAHYLAMPTDSMPMVGASAAVSGMTAATARFAFTPGGPLAGGERGGAYRVPAPPLSAALRNRRVLTFLALWFGINLLFGMESALIPGVDAPIAWQAHVGGFLAGLLAFSLLDPAPPPRHGDDRLAERRAAE